MMCTTVCVLHILNEPFFQPVDLRHTPCPCWLLIILERHKLLCSQNYDRDTTVHHAGNAVKDVHTSKYEACTYFLVGNYGLRRAERWDDMPSMSSEVGEIKVCLYMTIPY